jgi:YidC/Oxa1 family membrane protein insertase
MADSVNSGGNQGTPRKEISMELRLLMAFLLMGGVLFLTPYIFKSNTPPAKKVETAKTQTTATQPAPTQSASAPEQAKAEAAKPAPVPGATPQNVLPPLVIETDFYRIRFSNQGATVRSWELKNYKGNDKKPLEIVNTAAGMEYPFSLYAPGQDAASKIANWAYYTQTVDPDGLGAAFAFSDGHVSVTKTFRFQKNSYLSKISTEMSIDGKAVPAQVEWRGGFGDLTVLTASGASKAIYFDLTANKFVQESNTAAKNGPVSTGGNYTFAGLADAYFAAVVLPQGSATIQQTTFTDYVRTPAEGNNADAKKQPFAGMAVSDGGANHFDLFVGPKDYHLLGRINPKLQQLVDFGTWFGWLAKPLFLMTAYINSSFIHNYGWSIVAITVILNLLLFPLKITNMKSMRKMQALKPQIDAINQKYKNIGLRDPKKAEQNQEVMALYKQNGVNPMGGCVPMLIQLPFFFAFYKVFSVSAEMRGASWLWVTDLSQPEQIAIRLLPIVLVASQFLMQKMTPQAGTDASQQKMMMMMMPLIFGFMFYNFASGLVLYYLTSNLVSIGQQLFFNHTAAADRAAESVVATQPKRKIGRK